METKSLDTLKPSDYNPRTMSREDFKSLVNSMTRFGDLSGVVKNNSSGQLVGGHMRLEAFKKLKKPEIVITQKFEEPNENGTVAVGYIKVANGEQFAYREVFWDEGIEKAANIAANRIQGEFNLDQLAEVNSWLAVNSPELLDFTGQTQQEIDSLLDSTGVTDSSSKDDKLVFKPDPSQAEVISEALHRSRQENHLAPSLEADTEALYLICRDYLDTFQEGES